MIAALVPSYETQGSVSPLKTMVRSSLGARER